MTTAESVRARVL